MENSGHGGSRLATTFLRYTTAFHTCTMFLCIKGSTVMIITAITLIKHLET